MIQPAATEADAVLAGLDVGPVPPPAADDGKYTFERALRILRDGIRPEDRLPLTAEARRMIALHEQYYSERLGGVPPAESYMHGVRVNEILAAHLPGQHVVYLADEQGVVVLAVGLERMSRLMHSLPPDVRTPVSVTYVDDPTMLPINTFRI